MFARVLLTQRVDGLHYYNLEERGAGQREDCQAGQKKKKKKKVEFCQFGAGPRPGSYNFVFSYPTKAVPGGYKLRN